MTKYEETKKDGIYWVDKEEFYQAICEHRKEQEKDPDAPMSNYIGQCITNIAHGVMSRYNFNRYSYRQEMIQDAILTCIKYYNTFDVNRSKNPYGYFWLASYRSGQRKVILEKEQQAIKAKTIQNMVFDDDSMTAEDMAEFNNYMSEFSEFDLVQYDESRSKKKKKKANNVIGLVTSKAQREAKENEKQS